MATAGTGSPKLKILVMNTGGKGSVKDRREIIKERVNSVTPDVIFLQEANKKDRSVVGYAQVFGRDEASVMVKSKGESNENHKAYEKTHVQMPETSRKVKRRRKNNDIPSFEISRVASCRFDDKIVCVSWHSRHTGIKDGSKTNSLIALLRYIQEIKGELPFILGGDFNIEASKIREELTKLKEGDLAGLKLYDAGEKYEEKVMVIASSELVAQRPVQLYGTDIPKDKRVLDHLQLELEFSISNNTHLDRLKAALTHTLFPDDSIDERTPEVHAQARHLLTINQKFITCVKTSINACTDYQESIRRAHEIVDTTEQIVNPFLNYEGPTNPLKGIRERIDETQDEKLLQRVKGALIAKLTDMFKRIQMDVKKCIP